MHWITLILGIWVFISPWLLGFSDNAAGLWSNILAGLILVIVSIYGLSNTES
ncbi:SPW repeat protein [Candidatus Berkelbacteria bacterium]|nr:SPW repeat protein [Candidatus Berkelbacteria bacterium]